MICLNDPRIKKVSILSEERILLNKLAQGDANAFWQLWESYRDYLYHRCRVWMGGSLDDAQEVMSLASLKAWEELPKYAGNITNLKGWLNRLTHNLCMDIHRQRDRHALGVDNIDDVVSDRHETINSSSLQPEAALLQQELNVYLRYCIDALPTKLRDVLILNYYQNMSQVDIGKQLSISQPNVARRLQKARQILKLNLSQYFAGQSTVVIDKAPSQELAQKDFQLSISTDSAIEEINYRITISCLETLSLV